MNAEELWLKLNIKAKYDTFSFPSDLINLVKIGKKKATSSLYIEYGLTNDNLPEIGEYSVILDDSGNAQAIIKETNVRVLKFNEMTEALASLEGEGDLSLSYWKKVHIEFFTNVLKEYNLEFKDTLEIVFEEFELVYSIDDIRLENTLKYKQNKIKYIPKADIEMMREDRYEECGNISKKKYRY